MDTNRMPTAADIYLEVNGKKVAVVQSYRVAASRTSKLVEAFGQEEPVAAIPGCKTYQIELSRLYATDEAIRDGIDFFELEDFSLVVCKPDRSTVYSGCQWENLEESSEVGGMVLEKVKILAACRKEVRAVDTPAGTSA